MTKEEFIKANIQLAVDFWTMSLIDCNYENSFKNLLHEYESSQGLAGMAKDNSMPITNVVEPSFDLEDVINMLNEPNKKIYYGSSSGKCTNFFGGINNESPDVCVYCGYDKIKHNNK